MVPQFHATFSVPARFVKHTLVVYALTFPCDGTKGASRPSSDVLFRDPLPASEVRRCVTPPPRFQQGWPYNPLKAAGTQSSEAWRSLKSPAIDGLGGCIDGHMEVARCRLGACDVHREWPEPHYSLARVVAKAPEVAGNIPACGACVHLAPLEAVSSAQGPFIEVGDCIPHVLDPGQSLQILIPRAGKVLADDGVHS